MEYEVGKYYKVVCMKCKCAWNESNIKYIPIIDLLHKDAAFAAPFPHHHIDGRFVTKEVQNLFRMDGGKTNVPVWMDQQSSKLEWIPIEKVIKTLKCKRNETGLITDNLPPHSRYWTWYKTMIGKSCKGKRCPHLGTEMLERNGQLVCPLHNLVGCIEQEIIIAQ